MDKLLKLLLLSTLALPGSATGKPASSTSTVNKRPVQILAATKNMITDDDKDKPAHIVGHVRDASTMKFLPHILVKVKGTHITAMTDVTGHYMLKNLPVGDLEIEVSIMGYETQVHKITTTPDGTFPSDFEMEPAVINLNDVVVSATRNVTKRRLAPTLVNVLDEKIFNRTQSSFLSQALKFQPGLRVEDNCQNCGFSQVRINGLDGPYSQILVDSRPVFSALAGVYGLEQIPTNMIERIEIMRGGGSALFGSSAIAGVINIITKEPASPSASLSHEIRGIGGLSTFENTSNINATYVTDNNRMGFSVFGQIHHRSPYDYDKDGYSEMPKLHGNNVGLRTFFHLSDCSKLTAELHNTREFRRGGDRFDYEPHDAHVAEQLRHNNLTGSINYTFFSKDEHHRLNAFASFMKVKRESYYGGGAKTVEQLLEKAGDATTPFTPDDALELKKRMASYGRTNGLTNVFGLQYSCNIDKLLFMPSELTLGLEYNGDRLKDKSGFRSEAIDQNAHTTSGYIQNEWKTERWSFLVGGRLDKHSLVRHVIVSPRANVRFNPTKDIVLRANYSSGFRAPQIFDEDLHVDNAGGDLIIIQNASNLHEERSNSFSLSADWYKQLGQWQLNLTGETFYTQLRDAFTLTQSRITDKSGKEQILKTRSNSDGAKVIGASIEGRLAYPQLLSIQLGLTCHQSRWDKAQQWNEDDAYTTRRMYRSPDVYGYFVSTWSVTKSLDLTLTGNFTGSMLVGHEIPTEEDGKTLAMDEYLGVISANIAYDRVMSGEGQTDKVGEVYGPRTFKTPTFMELGLKAEYSFPIYTYYQAKVFAGIQNIFNAYQKDFDKGYNRDSAYIYGPMSPRSFYAGFRLTF